MGKGEFGIWNGGVGKRFTKKVAKRSHYEYDLFRALVKQLAVNSQPVT